MVAVAALDQGKGPSLTGTVRTFIMDHLARSLQIPVHFRA